MNRPGPKPVVMTIDGVGKTASEWARDPRCVVTEKTIRRRHASGVRGRDLILEGPKEGRPRNPVDAERLEVARTMDAGGHPLAEINRALRALGKERMSRDELLSLHGDVKLPPEAADRLAKIHSPWRLKQVAAELGIPLSVARVLGTRTGS